MPHSIFGRACQPSCSKFSVVFSETCINTDEDTLERPPMESIHPAGPCAICGHLFLISQHNSTQRCWFTYLSFNICSHLDITCLESLLHHTCFFRNNFFYVKKNESHLVLSWLTEAEVEVTQQQLP